MRRDVIHPVEDVTGEDLGVGLTEVTDTLTEDDGGHVVTGPGYDTVTLVLSTSLFFIDVFDY